MSLLSECGGGGSKISRVEEKLEMGGRTKGTATGGWAKHRRFQTPGGGGSKRVKTERKKRFRLAIILIKARLWAEKKEKSRGVATR